jgi:hypothetical protein
MHSHAVGHQQRVGECGIRGAHGTHYFAIVIDLDQAAGGAKTSGIAAMMLVLERRDDIAAGHAHERVRMHVAVHVREGSPDLRPQRIVHVEDERASDVMIVGEQHAARRHHVFGVVNAHGLLIRANACDQFAVGRRGRIRIDDGEKVIALELLVTGPRKEVVAGSRRRPRQDERQQQKSFHQKSTFPNRAKPWLCPGGSSTDSSSGNGSPIH